MKKDTKKIAWEKWENVLGADTLETLKNNIQQEHKDTIVEEEEEMHTIIASQPMMMTPMGAIPVPIYNENNFNFWLGHTNFDITEDIRNIVETTEGVETLDIFTRYRMRIGIGKIFSAGKVMRQINMSIMKYLK